MRMRLVVLGLVIGLAAQAQTGSTPPDSDSGADSERQLTVEEREALEPVQESITIRASPLGPRVDPRNAEIFNKTLFTRDDQVFHLLGAGINAGQHEGGGKSLEIRRFGYNLDHGGVGGGLRITVDNVVQNRGTQGHGQGYLGSLKSMSPELINDVTLINGPFSASQGDYSGLGVVQILLKEELPDVLTVRLQGGSFDTFRGFLAYSPNIDDVDAVFAYEGSYTDGPFVRPLDYERHNVTGNYIWRLDDQQRFGFKWNGSINRFNSSGQIPLDLVVSGQLDRFGAVSPGDGGTEDQGRIGAYYSRTFDSGGALRGNAFIERSLFDLYSNFTFFLNDPVNSDAIQQHDSRLTQGGDLQYQKPQTFSNGTAMLTVGGSFLASQNLVDLRQAPNRNPIAMFTSGNASVTNGSGYIEEAVNLANGRLQLTGGLRLDVFRYALTDNLEAQFTGSETAAEWQPKASVAFTPWSGKPLRAFFNYGRGISSLDARGAVRRPDGPLVAFTDFYQVGTQHDFGRRFSAMASLFLIRQSNQLVYIPDDGTIEFADPSQSQGFETRINARLTNKLILNGGVTKVTNAYFRDTNPRVYLDSAPRFTANGGLTLADWRGWSGSLRMRAINHYPLDGIDQTIEAAGHTVFDSAISREITHKVSVSLAVDNLFDREFFETQNFFESRVTPDSPVVERIHATPGFGRTIMVGLTFRLGGK